MTGDQPGDRVGTDCRPDSPRSLGRFHVLGNRLVTGGFAGLDGQKRPPHLALPWRSIERQREFFRPCRGEDALGPLASDRVVTSVFSGRIAGLQIGKTTFDIRIGEGHGGQAARCDQHDGIAEWRWRDTPGELQACPATLGVTRRHRLMGDEQVVQTPGPRQTRLESCIEHAGTVFQRLAGGVMGQCPDEFFRRDTDPARKDPLKMVRRKTGRPGGPVEVRMVPPIITQKSQGTGNAVIILGRGVERIEFSCHGSECTPSLARLHPLLAAARYSDGLPEAGLWYRLAGDVNQLCA